MKMFTLSGYTLSTIVSSFWEFIAMSLSFDLQITCPACPSWRLFERVGVHFPTTVIHRIVVIRNWVDERHIYFTVILYTMHSYIFPGTSRHPDPFSNFPKNIFYMRIPAHAHKIWWQGILIKKRAEWCAR